MSHMPPNPQTSFVQTIRREKRQLLSQREALETQLQAASQVKGPNPAEDQLKLMHKENLVLQQRLSKLSGRKADGFFVSFFDFLPNRL